MIKRIRIVFLVMGIGLVLSACSGQAEETEVVKSEPEAEQTETAVEDIRLLVLDKALKQQYEWTEDYEYLLAASEHSSITLAEASAEEYPELAEALNMVSVMQNKTMSEEFDNLVSFAKEEMTETGTMLSFCAT